MLKICVLLNIVILTGISCRIVGWPPAPQERQLFLSKRVVTEAGEFDGGVMVDDRGVIEAVLRRDAVQALLAETFGNFRVIDAGNLALMAGVVDSHVHVNEPGRTSWEGYVTATGAAAAGGITTIIDMPLNSIPPTTTVENLKIKASMAREEIYVDVGFWGGVIPGNEQELQDLVKAGVVGFKCFLINSGVSEFPYIKADELEEVFSVLNGTGTVLAFHAELQIGNTTTSCNGCDCPNPMLYETYLATHPEEMELAAVSLVSSLLNKTDCANLPNENYTYALYNRKFKNECNNWRPRLIAETFNDFRSTLDGEDIIIINNVHVHIVHVSSAGVVPILEQAREARVRAGYSGWRGGVTAETCHHYLTLSAEQVPAGRTEYKCSPPIRNQANRQKLWRYIEDHRLDLVASDHSPSVDSLKGTNFLEAWGGISSLQFDLPLFWTEAKARGYSLSTVSHYLSGGPAQLTGLQERKGAIRPGLDADLIFFDPEASFIVTPDVIHYKNKISPYMYRVLNGVVRQTFVRGQLVYAEGELVGQPKGELLLNPEFSEI